MGYEELLLRRNGQLRCRIPLSEECVSVGTAPFCDWMIHDDDAPREWVLLQRVGQQVRIYDVRAGALGQVAFLGQGGSYALDQHWSLERGSQSHDTCAVEHFSGSWEIRVGRGRDARRVNGRQRPISIGSDARNDVVLHDPDVDAFHARLEPHARGWIVRDRESRAGVWLDGYRIGRAWLQGYAQLRIGRSDIFLTNLAADTHKKLVAVSPATRDILERVHAYAEVSWPLLILGETGVGKEEVAHEIHRTSPRRKNAFVAVNAGGLPPHLIESELFGHEKGAFTSAHALRRGVFEQAQNGTVFLDEIGEMPLNLQARLLRVLETQCVRRVGAESETPADFRLICATHRDLRAMVAEGTFRADLYHRIRRLAIEIPPLRKRIEDIVPLALHFLAIMQEEIGGRVLSPGAQDVLLQQSWQGNARELRNVISTAALDTPHAEIHADDIERAIVLVCGWNPQLLSAERLNDIVADNGGNIAAAARSLGIPRTTLRDRLRQQRLRTDACENAS